MKNVILKFIIPVLIILFIITFVNFSLFIYRSDYAKTEIFSSSCGSRVLVVYTVGEPDFPFGQTHCLFSLSENGENTSEYSFSVKNDGANVSGENFRVVWQENSVTVTVGGSEQSDTEYTLYFDGTVTE